jgi:hypothetical protein
MSKREPRERRYRFDHYEIDWARQNLPLLRRYTQTNTILYYWMVITLIVGLAAHVLSDQIGIGAIMLPEGWRADFVADLLYNVGIALWTSVAITFFLEVIPDWQRKMAQRYIDELMEQAGAPEDGDSAEEATVSDLAKEVAALRVEIAALRAGLSGLKEN